MGTDILSQMKKIVFNMGYMINMEPFSIPRGLNLQTKEFLLKPWHIFYMILLYLPLAILCIYGFWILGRSSIPPKKENFPFLFLILLFLLFLLPLTQKLVSPRYIFHAYPLLYLIAGFGMVSLYAQIPSRIRKKLPSFST